MSTSNTFDVIMADPPWPYDNPRAIVGNGGRGSDGGKAAAIIQANVGQHYDVMTIEQIKALPVAALAAKDALLFLWVTNPHLAPGTGADVARAWGFKPFTVVTWAKIKRDVPLVSPSMKTGWWFRSASWARRLGWDRTSLRGRLNAGWSHEKAIRTPMGKNWKLS